MTQRPVADTDPHEVHPDQSLCSLTGPAKLTRGSIVVSSEEVLIRANNREYCSAENVGSAG